ncbi:hydroxyethylthiazole kinase [Paenibacillus xerothermodurans]|uniref:Hydroxyethylthiazole kinase n=1 Tax=Paenibacillus xerothermodurans TaxID=1977292 RepID=A0A2W1P558_PAEXE|nr:hydroxyethylthiazole kinase [Paenibacillus xerothermodurans]PZE22308.1 hydroxyethylthiazole kinase [Paenibacillus xerothermodurans]
MDSSTIIKLLMKLREKNPLVFNITNVVVTNFTANGLLALGASPVMAYSSKEVADMARIANALVLNIGTLDDSVVESMLIAGKAANERHTPVILDPVGAGATAYRTETSRMLAKQLKISVVRGNAAEVANLIGEQRSIKGVDAGEAGDNAAGLTGRAAQELGCVVAVTGKDDYVSDGTTTYKISGGDSILTKVTGTGCLLTAVIGAFTAVESNALVASAAALAYYGAAAQLAAQRAAGPGSFQVEFLDELARVPQAVFEQSTIEQIN